LINSSDPFGLCPKNAGGDGKTETFTDCVSGPGYYANEAANGRGGFFNDVKGVFATLWEGDLGPEGAVGCGGTTANGETLSCGVVPDFISGPGESAEVVGKLAGETGNFKYAVKALGINKNAASKELHAIKKAAGLRGADNVWIHTITGAIRSQLTGEIIGNIIP
jgi:hypothetical protein